MGLVLGKEYRVLFLLPSGARVLLLPDSGRGKEIPQVEIGGRL